MIQAGLFGAWCMRYALCAMRMCMCGVYVSIINYLQVIYKIKLIVKN